MANRIYLSIILSFLLVSIITCCTESQNSKALRSPIDEIAQLPYEPALCPSGDIEEPKWKNGLNKIYSPCPQVNIGIGTNMPGHKLDIYGTTNTSRLLVGSKEMSVNGSIAKIYVRNNTSDILQLGKKIGEDPPEVYFKVTNEGTVYAKEIWVKGIEDFPDYVFESDYELMKLEEVEKHIEEYGCLPKMPEAFEVENEGLNMAEMQIKMVEKIEELTLYVIALNRELDSLRSSFAKATEDEGELNELRAEQ